MPHPDTPHWKKLLERAQRALVDGKEVLVSPSAVRPMHETADKSVKGQPRVYFNEEALRRLGESMRTIGQIYPGIVRPVTTRFGIVRYELLDGERRWRAAKAEGLKYRAILVDVDDASAGFIIAAVANFNREGHTPLEVCDTIVHMLSMDIPLEEIARILGISYAWASDIHGLRKLTPEVRALLDPQLPKAKMLPLKGAIEISKVAPNLQLSLAERVLAKKVTLSMLRGEAVRVSRAAGAPIRQRAIEPWKQFGSLRARSEQVCRIARDLEVMLGSRETTMPIIAGRSQVELKSICQQLRGAAEVADRIAAHLEAIQQRRLG